MRQRVCVRAEARLEAEDGNEGSCCTPASFRRRAEQELGGGEPFDNVHGSAADWAVPESVNRFGKR
jgi:hypothetical protein